MPNRERPNSVSRRSVLAASAGIGGLSLASGTLAAGAGTALPASVRQPEGYTPKDSFFGKPFLDIDEQRQAPTPHRYIHGGFAGTDTRFSFYFPPREAYKGRLYQVIEGGMGGNENSALASTPQGVVPVASLQPAFALGGCLIESNQGHIGADLSGAKGEPSIICWRASAETARFAKFMLAQAYGQPPHHSYIFGGSGGGVRSLMCLEHVQGEWDGGVPFVMPHKDQGNFFTIQANAIRLLGQENVARIGDAVEVGGSNDVFAGLTNEQSQALALLYKTGFPRHVTLKDAFEAVLVWSWAAWLIQRYDPSYFTDFWTQPGYAGHDEPERLAKYRVQRKARVNRVLSAEEFAAYKPAVQVVDQMGIGEQSRMFAAPRRSEASRPVAVILDTQDTAMMGCAMLDFKTGAGVGRELYVLGVVGDALMLSGVGGKLLEEVKAGDEVMVDNSRYLAFCHHYRHQVDVRYPEERESMLDGAPLYPQRPQLERLFSGPYTYDLGKAKIIMVSGMTDRGTWPSSPVSYRTHLAKTMGVEPEQVSRIWYNERQQHVDGANMVAGPAPVPTTQFINYGGSVHEALRQLTAWVEEGKEPLPSSKHDYTLDSQVILAETAAERRGIQPLVRVTGNGKAGRVEVKRGEPVTFVAVAEAPPGAGRIVSLEWDFEGRGDWPVKAPVDGSRSRLEHSATHAFAKPGVYFPACRVVAHWNGAMNDPNFRLPNLGRIRVVVA